MNVLIVDDEMIAIQGMKKGVDWKSCGIYGEVHEAYNAAEASKIIDSTPIDIILCDIEMPGDNGIELLRQVKETNPEISWVFLTCHAKFEYAQEALRLGCQDYILTPAPYDRIEETLRKVVDELIASRYEKNMQKYGEQWVQEKEKQIEEAQGERKKPAEIVEEVAQYIINNLSSSELSIKQLANRIYLNGDYLNRIFKREKGISLNSFIIRERMNMATNLLKNPNISISSIAAEVGYSNYSYFVSTFKKIYGMTPTQYREKLL